MQVRVTNTGRGLSGPVPNCHLAWRPRRWHPGGMDEETGIYREDVMVMTGALADISTDTREILAILRDDEHEDDDEEEEADT